MIGLKGLCANFGRQGPADKMRPCPNRPGSWPENLSAVIEFLDERGHLLGIVGGLVAYALVLVGLELGDGAVDQAGGEDAVLLVEGAVLLEAEGRLVAGGGELLERVE